MSKNALFRVTEGEYQGNLFKAAFSGEDEQGNATMTGYVQIVKGSGYKWEDATIRLDWLEVYVSYEGDTE